MYKSCPSAHLEGTILMYLPWIFLVSAICQVSLVLPSSRCPFSRFQEYQHELLTLGSTGLAV